MKKLSINSQKCTDPQKIMAHNKNLYEEKYKQQINKTALDCKNVLKHNKFLIYQKQIIVYKTNL